MQFNPIDLHFAYQTLKAEFARRSLDILQVWQPTPDDPSLENDQLRNLLDWVEKYEACGGDRQAMEAEGYEFPPVHPCIEPETDWLIFTRWMQGLPVRQKVREQLAGGGNENAAALLPEDLEAMSDSDIEDSLQRLRQRLENSPFSIDVNDAVPARLVFMILRDVFEDELELLMGGAWNFDGCSGVCPECVQRPWCKAGGELCWPEDENAGEMAVPDAVRRYVCSSPVSLQILQQRQQAHDRTMES